MNERVALLLVLAMFWGAALHKVWVGRTLVRDGYKLSEERKERQALVAELETLQLERQALQRPERLKSLAKRMGFRPALPHEQFTFED